MIYQDSITEKDFIHLAKERGICVSIYLKTAHLLQNNPADRLTYAHMVDQSIKQASILGEKEEVKALEQRLKDLLNDNTFWIYQGKSLCVLATPQNLVTYRLSYEVVNLSKASDRFYLKPLLPALHPQDALVLAISQKLVTLYQFTPAEQLIPVLVPNLPTTLAEATGRVLQNNSVAKARLRDETGKKVLQLKFVRAIEKAIKPVVSLFNLPLIIASTNELAAFYRTVNTYSKLWPESIIGSVENITLPELVNLTKPVILKIRNESLDKWNQEYEEKSSAARASSDLATIARLASQGRVSKLLVDVDSVIYGRFDDAGAYKLLDEQNVHSYDLIDEIVDRVMTFGGEVLAVRHDETVAANLLPISASFRWE